MTSARLESATRERVVLSDAVLAVSCLYVPWLLSQQDFMAYVWYDFYFVLQPSSNVAVAVAVVYSL